MVNPFYIELTWAFIPYESNIMNVDTCKANHVMGSHEVIHENLRVVDIV